MREIKFRAWDKINKYWLTNGQWYLSPDGKTYAYYTEKGTVSENIIVSQYTGLKDKNGKEMYEGDIVNWSSWEKDSKEAKIYKKVHQIYWDIYLGSWKIGTPKEIEHESLELGVYSDIEVIGNIYENSELLK